MSCYSARHDNIYTDIGNDMALLWCIFFKRCKACLLDSNLVRSRNEDTVVMVESELVHDDSIFNLLDLDN